MGKSDNDDLYQAAIADPVFNCYDKAFIFKDLFLTIVPSCFGAIASAVIVFVPLSEFQQGAIVALNAPISYYGFKRSSPLEKIVKDKQ